MSINYRSLTCSTADALVIYLLEGKLEVSNEELNKNIKFAEERDLFKGMVKYIDLQDL